MHLTFAPRDILQIDDAKIIFRNFEGRGDKFNREGDRNFSLIIEDPEIAEALIERGWNIKIREGREEGDPPFMRLAVKVKFNDRGPNVILNTNGVPNRLTEETIGILDNIDIASVDLDIAPSDWNVNGKTGRAAYLRSMHVVQQVDRFAARYANKDEWDDDSLDF